MQDPIARLLHVTLRYESGAQALNDVSLTIRRGEHVCVLGANGSGKSTLASVLCGLLAPDEGVVELTGELAFDSSRQDPIDFSAYARARRNLGLVFQNPDDQIVTTVVEEDVAFGPENLGVRPEVIGQRVERELHRVAMQDYAKADPTRLSGGQKQRVAIAGALAMEPQLIVFDEPGALLDVRGRNAIMRVMTRLSLDNVTIVHITHFMEEALKADRVIVLDRGCVVLEGMPNEVFRHAEELAQLGLEEPFASRLARRLQLPWTCDRHELEQAILQRRAVAVSPAGSTHLVEPGHDAALSEPKVKQPSEPTRPADSSALSSQPVVNVEHVSYWYGKASKALSGVSFFVDRGTSVAIVGQTGSGKSTLLRLLCALAVPDTGQITIHGIGTRRKRDRRRLHGTIGYVMQHPERQLFAETVLEDVAFGPFNLGLDKNEVQARCQHALDLVGLVGYDDASPFELSGGQQRLCAIAGVLAMEPKTLVLDEPTAGLDPRGRNELRHILADIHARGITTIEVTHSMDDAALAQKVIVLNQSSIMLAGTPREVFCKDNAKSLAQAGLGLPTSLQLALDLGLDSAPLTFDDLVLALTDGLSNQEPF